MGDGERQPLLQDANSSVYSSNAAEFGAGKFEYAILCIIVYYLSKFVITSCVQ